MDLVLRERTAFDSQDHVGRLDDSDCLGLAIGSRDRDERRGARGLRAHVMVSVGSSDAQHRRRR